MSEKPEALRLAERIDLRDYYDFDAALHCPDAAIELRRQHAEIERLREALPYDWDQLEACRGSLREHMAEIKRLTADNERLTATAFQAQNAATDLAYRYQRLREALESIAANACCDRCQEAALVAKAALRREETT
jgi:predicted nuclease with TOPRIM domain